MHGRAWRWRRDGDVDAGVCGARKSMAKSPMEEGKEGATMYASRGVFSATSGSLEADVCVQAGGNRHEGGAEESALQMKMGTAARLRQTVRTGAGEGGTMRCSCA